MRRERSMMNMPDDEERADEFHRLEQSYVREERWEDLAGLLIERTEKVDHAAGPSALPDARRTDFRDQSGRPRPSIHHVSGCVSGRSIESGAGHWSGAHGRHAQPLAGLAGRMQRPGGRDGAGIQARRHAGGHGGLVSAQSRRFGGGRTVAEAAMAADPANPAALRALVALHGQRGDWSRAAAYLASASANTSDALARVQFAFDAAEIYRNRLNDLDGATEQYRRVLDLSPGHPQATAVMAEIEWGRKDGLPHCLYSSHCRGSRTEHGTPGTALATAGWSAQNDRRRGTGAGQLPARLRG